MLFTATYISPSGKEFTAPIRAVSESQAKKVAEGVEVRSGAVLRMMEKEY